MKRAAVVFALLLVTAAMPVYAVKITSVDDVIRMHRGGTGEDEILAALQRLTEKIDVAPEDVIALRDAGVPDRVIEAVLAVAKPLPEPEKLGPVTDSASPGRDEAEEEPAEDECVTYDPPLFLFPPGWIIPRWLWDPNWFMPRLHQAGPGTKQASVPASRQKPATVVPKAEPSRLPTSASVQPERRARPAIEQAGGAALGPRPRG